MEQRQKRNHPIVSISLWIQWRYRIKLVALSNHLFTKCFSFTSQAHCWGRNNNKTHIRPNSCIALYCSLSCWSFPPLLCPFFIVCWTQQAVLNGDRGWIGPTPHKIEFHQYKVNTITRLSACYGRVGIPAEWIRSTFHLMAVAVASFFHFRNRSYSAVTFSGHGYSLAVYPVMDLFDLCVHPPLSALDDQAGPFRLLPLYLCKYTTQDAFGITNSCFIPFTHTEIDLHNISTKELSSCLTFLFFDRYLLALGISI